MLVLPDLRDIVPAETLSLVIDGTTYVVTPCNAADYKQMAGILDQLRTAGEGAILDVTTDELQHLTLAGTRDQMADGGVTHAEITRSAWTAFYWHLDLEEVARDVWRGTPQPAPEKAKPTKKAPARRR